MRLSVLLFASYAEAFGRDRVELELPPGAVVGDAVGQLRASREGASPLPHPMVAVNRRYAAYEQTLAPGDELAIIPPVAGG